MSTAAKASRFHMAGFGVCEMLAEKDIRKHLQPFKFERIKMCGTNLVLTQLDISLCCQCRNDFPINGLDMQISLGEGNDNSMDGKFALYLPVQLAGYL